jgi:hypothetical protein
MAYTDSEPVTAELTLVGVWIHDPGAGGQDTSRSYPYGRSQRELALDMLGEANYYAGRTSPVVDYGEHDAVSFRVSIDIPHGPNWRTDLVDLRAFATGKQTLFFRDNRGRALYGQMEEFREIDQDWGTQVNFTVAQSHWDRELVS